MFEAALTDGKAVLFKEVIGHLKECSAVIG